MIKCSTFENQLVKSLNPLWYCVMDCVESEVVTFSMQRSIEITTKDNIQSQVVRTLLEWTENECKF